MHILIIAGFNDDHVVEFIVIGPNGERSERQVLDHPTPSGNPYLLYGDAVEKLLPGIKRYDYCIVVSQVTSGSITNF